MNVPVITLELNNWSLGPLAVLSARGGNETEFRKCMDHTVGNSATPQLLHWNMGKVSTPAASQTALRATCVRSLALSCSLVGAGASWAFSHGGALRMTVFPRGDFTLPPSPSSILGMVDITRKVPRMGNMPYARCLDGPIGTRSPPPPPYWDIFEQ